MKNLLTLVSFSVLVASCGMMPVTKSTFDITKPGSPSMRWMYDGPPPRNDGKSYDTLYVEGWVDGCETGAAGNTNSFYKFTTTFKQDAIKAQDERYYKGWRDSFFYCGRYIYQYNRRLGF